MNCLKVCATFARGAAIAMSGFINIGCIEDLAQKTQQAQPN